MARSDARQLDFWTRIWLGCAALWSLGLIAAGFFVSSYSTTNSVGSSSTTNGPGATLVQENGLKVLIILLIPLAGVVIVTLALRHRLRAQMPGVGVLVWVVFGLLALLVVLGALTIGPFIGPAAVFVIVAITRVNNRSTSLERVTL